MKGWDSRREEVKDNGLGLRNRVVIITSLKLIKACRADSRQSFHLDGSFFSSAEAFSQSVSLKAGTFSLALKFLRLRLCAFRASKPNVEIKPR